MSTENRINSPPMLPPISMFTNRSSENNYSIIPTSPPSSFDKLTSKSLPILPKPSPNTYYSIDSPPTEKKTIYHTPTIPDQNTLWALFNQFQQAQQQAQQQQTSSQPQSQTQQHQPQQTKSSTTEPIRRSSETTPTEALSSEEVLAEKRRRNAGASARFRDRRKQREKELFDKCNELEQRTKDLENALRCFDSDHPLLSSKNNNNKKRKPDELETASNDQVTLVERVGQLENIMTRFKQEKESDSQQLEKLEKENKYLRSLLIPIHLSKSEKEVFLEQRHRTSKRQRSSSISDLSDEEENKSKH